MLSAATQQGTRDRMEVLFVGPVERRHSCGCTACAAYSLSCVKSFASAALLARRATARTVAAAPGVSINCSAKTLHVFLIFYVGDVHHTLSHLPPLIAWILREARSPHLHVHFLLYLLPSRPSFRLVQYPHTSLVAEEKKNRLYFKHTRHVPV